MGEQRLGEDWHCGIRVQYWSTWQKQLLEGVITGRAYGRDDSNRPIYHLEIDAGLAGPREVVAWDRITLPADEPFPILAAIDGEEWAAEELGRHHGRVYVQHRRVPNGPVYRGWVDADDVLPRLSL